MEAGALLIAARFVHFAASLSLFGLALFAAFGGSDVKPKLRGAAVAALASGMAWLGLAAAGMAGDLAAASDPAILTMVLTSMEFGRIWGVRLMLGLALVAAAFAPDSRARSGLILALSAVLAASIALTGHSRLQDGGTGLLHVAADALHLLASGAWLGGLFGLMATLRRHDPEVGFVLRRFSRMGYGAVAVIVATGLVKGVFLVGSFESLWTTPYGRILAVKVGLFAGMAALAALNRFALSPHLQVPASEAAAAPCRAALRRTILAEQALGAMVLLAVAVLGTLEPAANAV